MIPPQNVSEAVYRREVAKRIVSCEKAIRRWSEDKVLANVMMVLLSCKRPNEIRRLLESLDHQPFALRGIDAFWSVDNGSGAAVTKQIESHHLPWYSIQHPYNLGMGEAINRVLDQISSRYILFVEDDLVLDWRMSFAEACMDIFRQFPEVGIIKLKRKADWDTMYLYRRIGPMQTTTTGVRFHPWLPSPRWSFRWGQRPWYPVGIHNVWSLGPVMFRWCAWKEAGPIPSGQGRGQAVAAEEEYARRFNVRWIAAKPVDFAPFSQPVTRESPGFGDRV